MICVSHLVQVHDEGVRIAHPHVQDVRLAGKHVGRSSLHKRDNRQLSHVLIFAQQCERLGALAALQSLREAATVQPLQLPVPAIA